MTDEAKDHIQKSTECRSIENETCDMSEDLVQYLTNKTVQRRGNSSHGISTDTSHDIAIIFSIGF